MKNLRSIFLFGLVCLSGSFAATAQKVENTQPAATPPEAPVSGVTARDDRYRIGYKDVLNIEVFNQPKLSGRVAVAPNGTIQLFRLEKPIVAVCKTEGELAEDIENAYRVGYLVDPQVKVFVAEQKSQSISVMGAVERPGTYYVNRSVHLLEILAEAGGPNKEAGTRLLVARTGSRSNCKANAEVDPDQIAVMDFKIKDIQEGKRTLWMLPGDVISVMDADVVYVYGNVNKQGAYRVREAITLTQAIVSAEGLKPAAEKDKVRILRQAPNSLERVELVFSLNDIDKGKAKDPFLEPNDIVAVSRDNAKAIFSQVLDTVKGSVPGAVYRFP